MAKPALLLLASCTLVSLVGFLVFERSLYREEVLRHKEQTLARKQEMIEKSFFEDNFSDKVFSLDVLDLGRYVLNYEDVVLGGGEVAESGDVVIIHYEGAFEDGEVFDSSRNPGRREYQFRLGEGVPFVGLDEGIRGMSVGGIRVITVPYTKGFGAQDFGAVPAYSTLVYTVELLSVFK